MHRREYDFSGSYRGFFVLDKGSQNFTEIRMQMIKMDSIVQRKNQISFYRRSGDDKVATSKNIDDDSTESFEVREELTEK